MSERAHAYSAACAVLILACTHEFLWQAAPPQLQRDVRDVTQWPLLCVLLWCVHLLARHRFLSAVCAAVAVMSSTTALCAGWWLIDQTVHQCSQTYQPPLMLLSAVAALATFWRACDARTR